MGLKIGNINLAGVYLGDTPIAYIFKGSDDVFSSEFVPTRWITFESSDSNTLSWYSFSSRTPKFYYSYDKTTWTEWDRETTLSFDSNNPLYFAGKNLVSLGGSFRLGGSGFVSCSGSIMSLLGNVLDLKQTHDNMFSYLFSDNNLLVKAPELTSSTIATACYYHMFYNCPNLNSIVCLASNPSWDSPYWNSSWLWNCAEAGTFYKRPDVIWPNEFIPEGWVVKDYVPDYLTFTNTSNSVTIVLGYEEPGEGSNPQLYYSWDKTEWISWHASTSFELTKNYPTVYVAGYNPNGLGLNANNYVRFVDRNNSTTGCLTCDGDIMSLINCFEKTDIIPNTFCFFALFRELKSLISAPILPAKKLPASCYRQLFYKCSNLKYIKCLATTFGDKSTLNWVTDINGTGDFIQSEDATWESGKDGIPSGWTRKSKERYISLEWETGDSYWRSLSLSMYPGRTELPVLYISSDLIHWGRIIDSVDFLLKADKPLYLVGYNPNGLNPNNEPAFTFSTALSDTAMAYGGSNTKRLKVSGDLTALIDPDNPVTQLPPRAFEGLFKDCGLIQAPDLLTPVLSESCYKELFKGNSNLNEVKCLATDISATNCTKDWLDGVANEGFLTCNESTPWTYGSSGIPTNWNKYIKITYYDDQTRPGQVNIIFYRLKASEASDPNIACGIGTDIHTAYNYQYITSGNGDVIINVLAANSADPEARHMYVVGFDLNNVMTNIRVKSTDESISHNNHGYLKLEYHGEYAIYDFLTDTYTIASNEPSEPTFDNNSNTLILPSSVAEYDSNTRTLSLSPESVSVENNTLIL